MFDFQVLNALEEEEMKEKDFKILVGVINAFQPAGKVLFNLLKGVKNILFFMRHQVTGGILVITRSMTCHGPGDN